MTAADPPAAAPDAPGAAESHAAESHAAESHAAEPAPAEAEPNSPPVAPASATPALAPPALATPAPFAPDPEVAPAAVAPRAPRAPLPFQQVGVIVVGMSLAVWWPAFTLGAWGEIFFDDLLAVWAAATAAFLVAVLLPGARKRLGWTSLTLLLPSVWLAIELIVPDSDDDLAAVLVVLVGALVVVVGIPFMIWALAKVIWPEIGETIPARGKLLVLLTVFVIAVASFLLGSNESRFLTCDDFTLSGNSEPPGCTPA